jgi:hypothetical protein
VCPQSVRKLFLPTTPYVSAIRAEAFPANDPLCVRNPCGSFSCQRPPVCPQSVWNPSEHLLYPPRATAPTHCACAAPHHRAPVGWPLFQSNSCCHSAHLLAAQRRHGPVLHGPPSAPCGPPSAGRLRLRPPIAHPPAGERRAVAGVHGQQQRAHSARTSESRQAAALPRSVPPVQPPARASLSSRSGAACAPGEPGGHELRHPHRPPAASSRRARQPLRRGSGGGGGGGAEGGLGGGGAEGGGSGAPLGRGVGEAAG